MRICYISSEISPLAKTGGLADVASALPRYLNAQGHDVRLFMPLYSSMGGVEREARPVTTAQDVSVQLGSRQYRFSLLETQLPQSSAPLYLIHCPVLYDRPTLYTFDPDEHLRFLLMQRAALESCQRLQFAPQIIHCNDWHTALVPLMVERMYSWDRLFAEARSVLTIHNIAFQGIFDASTADDIDYGVRQALAGEDLQRNCVNWMREGIRRAHAVNTVSPTYASEISAPEGGCGLDHTLRARTHPAVGILNGVDYSEWNPKVDRYLTHRYDAADLSGKAANKRVLLDWLGLKIAPEIPVIGLISRFTAQKGLDLAIEVLPNLLNSSNACFIALGSGERRYEDFFADLARRFGDRVAYRQGFNEELAHLVEAGADMFLMPSLFEPCGLNQMYSMKYGTVPIVRKTGGLADSVHQWDPVAQQGTGIVFSDFNPAALRGAIDMAMQLFAQPAAWQRLVQNGMSQDFSWQLQGKKYEELYARTAS
jgi:starch synthase